MRKKSNLPSEAPEVPYTAFMRLLEEHLETKGRPTRKSIVSSHMVAVQDGILASALKGYSHYDHSLMGVSPGYFVALQKATEALGVRTTLRLNAKTGGTLRVFLPD